MRRVLAFLSLGAVAASAGDAVAEAADAVLAGGDLKAMAAKDDPDPWLVADELCARGKLDEADAFARAVPRKDVERLPEYVASQRGKPTTRERREVLRAVNTALAANDWERVLALAVETGQAGDVTGVRLQYARGLALHPARRWGDASLAFRGAADGAAGLGWVARQAAALNAAGHCHYSAGGYREALDAWERRLQVDEARSNTRGIAKALANIGLPLSLLGDKLRALECQTRAYKLLESLGDRAGAMTALTNIGNLQKDLGNYPQALEVLEQALALARELGDRAGEALALTNLGLVHRNLGDYARAMELQRGALRLREELGDKPGAAQALVSIGNIYERLGDYQQALVWQERSLALSEELGDVAGIAVGLSATGAVHRALGDLQRAMECQTRALRLFESMGDQARVAVTKGEIGTIYFTRGDYVRALEYQERSLGLKERLHDGQGIADTLGNLGLIHAGMGDFARALEYQERALKIRGELGDRKGVAYALANIGNVCLDLRDHRRALECEQQALGMLEEIGDSAGAAAALANIGRVHMHARDYPRALEVVESALRMAEKIGDRRAMATALSNLGIIHNQLGNYPRGLECLGNALAAAREIGDAEGEMSDLRGLASVQGLAGRYGEALRLAREAVAVLSRLASGLGEEQGARARERWVDVFEIGAFAAMELGDPGEVAFFLESGRSAGLLESLGGRAALRSRAVPEALQALERDARARESTAVNALHRALKAGERAAINACRADLDKAQAGLEETIARIQREAKEAGELAYGRVDSLDEIRGRVREGEALVLYGSRMALVVTRGGGRVVKLEDVDAACAANDWRRLRSLMVDPLGLDPTITRLLVSPAGPLSHVPFCLLAPDREVVYAPSGTAYGLLLGEARKRGEGVLALGDPDYGAKPEGATLTVLSGGAALDPLPATGEEARAVGDTLLLKGDATKSALMSEIGKRARWRAVHFACHGLVNQRRAQLSSLALSGGDFLTVLDVFERRIPTDLVVLSACETAKGAVYRAEGVMGFVRAFMFAGAPRVIVSLWKVDDEATKALMVRFYELWKAGKPAATALKEAQRFVASHEKWKDPKYWAAWQLWGLAE